MERVTATIDERTLAQIRRIAGPRGVSSFLATAAKERVARLELLGLLDELDAKYGAPSASVRTEVARDARRIFRASDPDDLGRLLRDEPNVHVRKV